MEHRVRLTTACALLVLFAAMAMFARPTCAQQPHSGTAPNISGGQILPMAKFYTGPLERIGTFPGKLVCLRCDLAPSKASAAQCKKEGHVHALSMDDGSMIHPLLATSSEVLARINSPELHHQEVKVHGKYYVSTGAILVSSIERVNKLIDHLEE
jgi:hypothetical protein